MKLLPRIIRTSIQNKLFVSFLVLLLLLAAVVTASFIVIGNLGKASDKILKMNYNSIIASMEMMDNLETVQREYILRLSNPGVLDNIPMIKAQKEFSEWFGRAEDNITENGERLFIARIDSLYGKYIAAIDSSYPREENGVLEIESLRYQIRQNCKALLKINQDAMFIKSNAAQNIARSGTVSLILIALLVFISGIGLSWGLSRRIVLPILKLKDATQHLAQGDYSVKLSKESEDELGILTSEFALMADKLSAYNDLNIRTIMSEQKKTGAILENIQDGIFFIGADFTILDANNAALEAFKLDGRAVIGHHYLEIIKQDALFADLKYCLETRKPISYDGTENVLVMRRNNKKQYLEYFFTPVITAKNELLGALFLLRDITNLKELDSLKSEFVMIVSHELKTPLTSINMSIDLLRESMGNSPKKEDLELIQIAKEEINRLRLLISDLLDLSKIESGKIDMHFASVGVPGILTAVEHSFKNQIADTHTSMEIYCPADLPNIWCDDEKLMLVFSNLVANALKALVSGGHIQMSAEPSGKYIQFCVKDNGVGIPLSYQNKIFDRFVQVEEQKAARGTGLGLTISREIVRANGGSIWVESSPGNGASFYFTIPIDTQSWEQTIKR